MKILFAGGGSGGHIYPLSAVIESLKKASVDYSAQFEMHYLGPIDIHSEILKSQGVILHGLVTGKIRRYFSIMNIVDIPKFFIGQIEAFIKLLFLMPDIVFSKGGAGAFPVVFAAWFYRIPVVIHESDAAPGLNNLLSSRFAKRICISFESAQKYFDPQKSVLTGNPIRPSLLAGERNPGFEKNSLGFKEDRPLLLILGGSQGSKRINELIVSILGSLIPETQILHQTGIQNFEETQKLSKAVLVDTPVQSEIQNRYEILPYLDGPKMKSALISADLVIARAGSGTIFELANFGKPSILIPLGEGGSGDQKENAYALGTQNAALVIEERNLTGDILLSRALALLKSPEERAKLSFNIGKFAHPESADMIAGEIIAAA